MSTVGDRLWANDGRWSFGKETAKNFDVHISRSVPFYSEGHHLVCLLSDFFIHPGSTVYDIGCSTGTLTVQLAQRNVSKQGAHFIGIDVEPSMIEVATGKRAASPLDNIDFVSDDALLIDMEGVDLIVCYYTIQFVRPSYRQQLIDKLCRALNVGGALIMFEKVRGPDARFQDIVTALYNDYKLDEGYEASEILAKSRSLKGILEPFSTQGNIEMLQRAGFSDIMTVMKYICFEGFVAIK